MTSIEEADSWIGRRALDNTGEQIGAITQIWVDDTSGQPEWASVKVRTLKGREALVPLAGTTPFGGGRRFAYTKEVIIDAPHAANDGRLEVEDKEQLAAYYGAPDTGQEPTSATWIGRMEDAADGATVREISALTGGGDPSSAAQAPAAPKEGRRFGRKPAPTVAKVKKAKRFRGNTSHSDQQPAELPQQHDEVSVGD